MPDVLDYSRLFSSKIVDDAAEDDIFTLTQGVLRNLVLLVANNTASPATIDGWVIPSGGSSGAGNQFLDSYSVAANSTVEIAIPKMISGDKLTLQAGTASALTVFDHDAVVRV